MAEARSSTVATLRATKAAASLTKAAPEARPGLGAAGGGRG
jgi:hypothetical protein